MTFLGLRLHPGPRSVFLRNKRMPLRRPWLRVEAAGVDRLNRISILPSINP
jgi:hypothetical protein